jgi:hypothetical protein
MDENFIGKVMAVGILVLAIWGAQALWSAQGEGFKRIRQLVGAAAVLFVGAILFTGLGPGAVVVVAAVIGTGVWIVRGFKK